MLSPTAFNPPYAVAIAEAMNSSRLLTQEATLNALCSCDPFLDSYLLYSELLKANTVLEVPGVTPSFTIFAEHLARVNSCSQIPVLCGALLQGTT